MQAFDSIQGRESLKRFSTATTLYAFDFDGTLAPIAEHPDQVAMQPEIKRMIVELSSMASVAIISGRRRSDLLQHLAPANVLLIGNHGAEDENGDSNQNYKAICDKWTRDLAPHLAEMQGIWLEEKGVSLSIHYRNTREPYRTEEALKTLIESLNPAPRLLTGLFVLNLTVPNSPNKGSALVRLMKKHLFDKAIFIGDDENDEDVFRLKHPDILTIKIGVNQNSIATYYVENQNGVYDLISQQISYLRKS